MVPPKDLKNLQGFRVYKRLYGQLPETRFHIKNRGLRFGRVGATALAARQTLTPPAKAVERCFITFWGKGVNVAYTLLAANEFARCKEFLFGKRLALIAHPKHNYRLELCV
jgi:hypothetical protein